MSAAWRDRLVAAVGPEVVHFGAPLAPRVAFRIGGPADALVRPTTPEMLRAVLTLAREDGVPVTVLGTGSNVLVADAGIRGIVLRLAGELADVHVGPGGDGRASIEVGAGALNAQLVALVLNLGLVGIEFLGTIPGTFGGALIMNAGAHGGEIAPSVVDVTLIDASGALVTRPRDACGFAYRTSAFSRGEVLVSARLSLGSGDTSAARAHLKEMRDRRRATQPIDLPNAGSLFKNPPGDFAGRLIEACGLKGRKIGGACISPMHANFVVNEGGATAADVVALAAIAEAAVAERFGVRLEWEVRRLGEWGEAAQRARAGPA